ncbi:phosphotransferase enzyme family protein [Aquiflexum sp.]|uniref:phosphotransferase enzyme family protein n=1 Tax=Aquiflexum sp. TaxID=1872584 RepID=UPI0035940D77
MYTESEINANSNMKNPSFLTQLNDAYGFLLPGAQIQKFGDGHIHKTFLIDDGVRQYILQQFNNSVFKNPERISHNHAILLDQINANQLPFELPLPIPNLNGELFTVIDGDYFRLSPFITGKCINEVDNSHQAYLAAKAFAHFIKAGIHIDASLFQEVIPGFNDLELRYNQLLEALSKTEREVTGELQVLVDFYLSQKDLVEEYLFWKERLPLRLTHNDTKINNLIFSENLNKVIAIIDLDTLTAGYVYYDFGDLVRTVACTEGENSTNWNNIDVDQDKFDALLNGLLEIGDGTFTKDEIQSLSFGGKMMTCIMGFRFLADYLNGNIYYTIHYEAQNLHRAKNHMHLLMALRKRR